MHLEQKEKKKTHPACTFDSHINYCKISGNKVCTTSNQKISSMGIYPLFLVKQGKQVMNSLQYLYT